MSEQIPFIQPMTAEQTIQALECCIDNDINACDNCPIDKHIKDDCACCRYLAENALNLIKELKIEYGKLMKYLVEHLGEQGTTAEMLIAQFKDTPPQIELKPKIIAHIDGKKIDITKFVKEV